MADMTAKNFDDLGEGVIAGLARYGIGKHEMAAMKFARENASLLIPEAKEHNIKFVTQEAIMALPDEVVEKYLKDSGGARIGKITPERLDRARIELSNNLSALYNAHADASSSTPNLRINAFMFGAADINTPSGAFRRMLLQFKSAGITAVENYKYMLFSGNEVGKGNYGLVAQAAALSMFYAAMSTYVKDALAGKTPRDPKDPNFLIRTAASAGFGAFVLDAIAYEVDKNSTMGTAANLIKAAAGPVISTGAELISMPIDFSKGFTQPKVRGGKRIASDAATWLIQNIPGQNLWAFKSVFAQFLSNPLRDWIDPGTTARMEQATRQTPGIGGKKQGYFIEAARPTKHVRY
jgi:hypothetical protein